MSSIKKEYLLGSIFLIFICVITGFVVLWDKPQSSLAFEKMSSENIALENTAPEIATKSEDPVVADPNQSLRVEHSHDMAIGRESEFSGSSSVINGVAYHTCSMHPSVKSATPGTCPICSMDLIPVTHKEVSSGSILVDARRRQLIGVKMGEVKQQAFIRELRVVGVVNYDETRLTDISLKYDGWIGELYANFVGKTVHKGEALFTVYSPELVSAQAEYLASWRRGKNSRKSGINENNNLLLTAKNRLRLWDLQPHQIQALQHAGQAQDYMALLSPASGTVIEKHVVVGTAVKRGQTLLRIADLSKVWVEADIYEADLPLVKTGMPVQISLDNLPGQTLSGEINYIYPYLQASSRTTRVRVELDNTNGQLKPAMYAQVRIKADMGERLLVPSEAVIFAGDNRIVFVPQGDDALAPRKITTGLRNGRAIEVLDGLKAGDKVVTSANFLLAAESKLKAGIEQWQ